MNREKVDEVLEHFRVYEQRLNSEGVPFTEQKLPGMQDLDEIEDKLTASAGAAPDDLIAWFHWQGGLVPGPGFGRATVYGGFVPLGLSDSIEETSEFRWAPYNYPTTTSGPNPWVLLAVQRPGSTMLTSNVISGGIHTVFTHGGDSNHMANSVPDMGRLWTDLWAVAFKWNPGIGVGLKIAGEDVPSELRARSGYVL